MGWLAAREHARLERDVHQLGARGNAQLLIDAGAVGIDALLANSQLLADGAMGLTTRDALEDLALSRCERRKLVRGGWRLEDLVPGVLSQTWLEIGLSLRDRTNGVQDVA